MFILADMADVTMKQLNKGPFMPDTEDGHFCPMPASFTCIIWSILGGFADSSLDAANGVLPPETAGTLLSSMADVLPAKVTNQRRRRKTRRRGSRRRQQDSRDIGAFGEMLCKCADNFIAGHYHHQPVSNAEVNSALPTSGGIGLTTTTT